MTTTATRTRVVHVNDNVPGAVYIGRAMPRRKLRGSPFGNSFTVKQYGRQGAVELYEYWLREFLDNDRTGTLHRQLADLAGKPLACWCRHDGEDRTEDNACHGDVLIELINELGLEQQP